jgi:hypothetical protein
VKVLALDISTSAGWAVFEDAQLSRFGRVGLDRTISQYHPKYPWNYLLGTKEMASLLSRIVLEVKPDVIVIEETNLGRNRYSQKVLEFIHCNFLRGLECLTVGICDPQVVYLSSSTWRRALSLEMSAEDRKNNAKLSRARSKSKRTGETLSQVKVEMGIRGKINKKHLAVRYVNETYKLNLKMKDNDTADAICLGAAYLSGKATPCDGVMG